MVFLSREINLTFFINNLQTKKYSTMPSKFSELPNNLIIKIIQIENDRRKYEKEKMKKKYNEVIQELNKLSSRYCDLDEGYWYVGFRGLGVRRRVITAEDYHWTWTDGS